MDPHTFELYTVIAPVVDAWLSLLHYVVQLGVVPVRIESLEWHTDPLG